MKQIPDGLYDISYSTEYDNGYGVESASDEVTIEIYNDTVVSVTAYGLHFINEIEVEWDVNIYDHDCIELIKEQYLQGYSFRVKHPVLYSETNRQYIDGWIDAFSKEHAIDKLCDQYHLEDDEVEVSHTGKWSDLLRDLEKEA